MRYLKEIIEDWPPRHHSYGISARNVSQSFLESLWKNVPVSYLYIKRYHQLSIDHVRELKNLQQERSTDYKVFVIQCSVIYQEAQNALLKIFEEPGINTLFVIIYPNIHALLPTLQSRIEEIRLGEDPKSNTPEFESKEGNQTVGIDVDNFIKSTLSERYAVVKKFLGSDADDYELGTHHHEVRNFLDSLEQRVSQYTRTQKNMIILKVILESKRYLSQQGSSAKIILDRLATHLENLEA